MIAAALLIAAAAPSAEALDFARKVTANGTLAAIAPIPVDETVEALMQAHPELTGQDRARLRTTATKVGRHFRKQWMETESAAFAAELPIEDLRLLAALRADNETIGRMLKIMTRAGNFVGTFPREVIEAFCAKTSKLCPESLIRLR